MSYSLYRKYRPKVFAKLIGQNAIKTTLQNEIETNSIVHAYLLAGPRGCGKTTTARLFAKAVNCLKRKKNESEPCNECESCQEINNGNSLDFLEIDAASHTGVDNVRENIIMSTRFTPTKRKYKIFVIDEVHMLSISAFNALLKTLEEPPDYIIFILATTEVHKLPQTIISRCQRFDFRRVNFSDIVVRLQQLSDSEKIDIDRDVLEAIAANADGSVRDAESLLAQTISLGDKKITLEQAQLIIPYSNFNAAIKILEFISQKKTSLAIDYINQLIEEGIDQYKFADDILECLRKTMLIRAGVKSSLITFDIVREQEQKLNELSEKFLLKRIMDLIELFIQTKQHMKLVDVTQLPLEVALVEACQEDFDSGMPKSNDSENVSGASKPKEIKSIPSSDEKSNYLSFTLDVIVERWNDILQKIKTYNLSLFSCLRNIKPLAIKNNIIQIGVYYDFHKDRITEKKNKEVIESVISEILGAKINIDCVILKSARQTNQQAQEVDSDLKNILEEFGGTLAE